MVRWLIGQIREALCHHEFIFIGYRERPEPGIWWGVKQPTYRHHIYRCRKCGKERGYAVDSGVIQRELKDV